MPRRSDKRDAAREAYLSRRRDGEEVNLQRLAEELGVKYDTLRRWKSADKWDEAQPPPKRTRGGQPMFANGTLQSIYPVSAALGLINYRAGAEGVMWNKGLCFISILIMCAIGIALMFVKQKPEKREAKKTQHTAPKKGW